MIEVKDKSVAFKILPDSIYYTCKYKIYIHKDKVIVSFYGFKNRNKMFIKKVLPELATRLLNESIYDYDFKNILWLMQVDGSERSNSDKVFNSGLYILHMEAGEFNFVNTEIIRIDYDFKQVIKLINKADEYFKKASSKGFIKNASLEVFVKVMAALKNTKELLKEEHSISENTFFSNVVSKVKIASKEGIAKMFQRFGFYIIKNVSIKTEVDEFIMDIVAIYNNSIIICKLITNDAIVSNPLVRDKIEEFKTKNSHTVGNINQILKTNLAIMKALPNINGYGNEIPEEINVSNIVIFMNNNLTFEVDVTIMDEKPYWSIDFTEKNINQTIDNFLGNIEEFINPPSTYFHSFVLDLIQKLKKGQTDVNNDINSDYHKGKGDM